ncbi:5'-nucleotidase-like [Ruditapes philippinarum]|uniref:5'-nucleotidase-like n=1 Tax=Ruditapes philippinarum TaxID=129788 RepID=UPI00295BEECB|nr:5'-nucleotidase-like [Ruditapes philippinarum]
MDFLYKVNNLFLSLYAVVLLSVTCISISGFEITVLHTNDVHARFEQFNKYGSTCDTSEAQEGRCFGGVARRHTKIQEIRNSHDNVILLDAGDQFMGTVWFTVHRGMAASYFMKELGYNAMCFGNHEFDLGVETLAKFLDNVTFPVVSANTDVTNEPRLAGKFSKSWTTTIGGEEIGVVGYLTTETAKSSSGGPTVKFHDVITAVQDEVAILKSQGINKIIALGHALINMDKQVAAIDGVDLVIGGHTNTFLYNGEKPADEDIEGPYPIVVDQPGGGKGLVVQAYTMGKYLGYLNLKFDSNGMVTNYSGNPILLDSTVSEDAQILREVNKWREPVDKLSASTVGYSKVIMDGERSSCRLKECNLGNLVTDGIVNYHINFSHSESTWAPAVIAIWNGGGIRSSIDKGIVSSGDIYSVLPFGNEIDILTVSGKNLREQLEHSVANYDRSDPRGAFLQMSGLRVVYNLQMEVGSRVVSVEARCLSCDIPKYNPLRDSEDYNIFVSTFIINGGSGYKFEASKRQRFNTLGARTLTEYFKKHSPMFAEVEGRIQFHTDNISSSGAHHLPAVIFIIASFVVRLL